MGLCLKGSTDNDGNTAQAEHLRAPRVNCCSLGFATGAFRQEHLHVKALSHTTDTGDKDDAPTTFKPFNCPSKAQRTCYI